MCVCARAFRKSRGSDTDLIAVLQDCSVESDMSVYTNMTVIHFCV